MNKFIELIHDLLLSNLMLSLLFLPRFSRKLRVNKLEEQRRFGDGTKVKNASDDHQSVVLLSSKPSQSRPVNRLTPN